jgi:hypothetical protein
MVIMKLTLLHNLMFDYCSHQIVYHTDIPGPCAVVAAQLYRQHFVHQSLPRIQLHAAATTAAICITMPDDASLGGKNATYL